MGYNSGTLGPPSEIGSELEDAKIEFIASFLNLKELNTTIDIFEVNRENYKYFVVFTTARRKVMRQSQFAYLKQGLKMMLSICFSHLYENVMVFSL